MKHTITVLAAAVLLTGCISTSVTKLSTRSYTPLTPEDVTIYLYEEDIPGDYEKVALITARGDYAMTDEAKMFKKVRQKAAKLGANGVLVETVREPSTEAKVANFLFSTTANRKGEMLAIYVLSVRDEGASH